MTQLLHIRGHEKQFKGWRAGKVRAAAVELTTEEGPLFGKIMFLVPKFATDLNSSCVVGAGMCS